MDMKKDVKRNKKIVDLYSKGVTTPKLAKIYDITRARVCQILEDNGIKREKTLDKK